MHFSCAPGAFFLAHGICCNQLVFASQLFDVPVAYAVNQFDKHDDIAANFVFAIGKYVVWS